MINNSSTFAGFVGYIIGYINIIIPVLVTIALALLMYGGVRYIYTSTDSKNNAAARDAMLWGLVALFIIVSIWGIMRLMCNTFVGTNDCRTASAMEGRLAIHSSVL